nr:MAG TPA: hypothetical protein [Caudoviricetes sp.]
MLLRDTFFILSVTYAGAFSNTVSTTLFPCSSNFFIKFALSSLICSFVLPFIG